MEAKNSARRELQKIGLNIGEDALMKVVPIVMKMLKDALMEKKSKWWAMLLVGLLTVAEKPALKLIDKIDGEEG